MGGATSRDIDAAATALASLAAADSTQEFIHLADEHKSVIDRFSSAGSSLRHSTCPLLLLDALDTGLRLLHSSSVSSSTGQQAGSRRARGAAAAAAANAARQNDELVHRLTQVLHAVLAWSWKLGPDTEMQWAGEAMEHMQASGEEGALIVCQGRSATHALCICLLPAVSAATRDPGVGDVDAMPGSACVWAEVT